MLASHSNDGVSHVDVSCLVVPCGPINALSSLGHYVRCIIAATFLTACLPNLATLSRTTTIRTSFLLPNLRWNRLEVATFLVLAPGSSKGLVCHYCTPFCRSDTAILIFKTQITLYLRIIPSLTSYFLPAEICVRGRLTG